MFACILTLCTAARMSESRVTQRRGKQGPARAKIAQDVLRAVFGDDGKNWFAKQKGWSNTGGGSDSGAAREARARDGLTRWSVRNWFDQARRVDVCVCGAANFLDKGHVQKVWRRPHSTVQRAAGAGVCASKVEVDTIVIEDEMPSKHRGRSTP